jgi:hypothetical protein
LFLKLLAVNKDKGVHTALRNKPSRNHGFAKSRCGSQNAGVMPQHRFCRRLLFGPQLAAKGHIQRSAAAAFVADDRFDF